LALPLLLLAATAALADVTPAAPALNIPNPNVGATAAPGQWKNINGSLPAQGLISIPVPNVNFTDILFKSTVADEKTTNTYNIPWLAQYISGVYKYAVGIGGILAAVMMMIGGIQYLTAGGDAGRVAKGKEKISDAILGLFLVLGTYMILNTINPNLVSMQGLVINAVRPEPYVPNETPYTDGDPVGELTGPLPPVPPGTIPFGTGNPPTQFGVNNIPFFGQCIPPQHRTPYLDQEGRCTFNPDPRRPPTKGAPRIPNRPYTICSSGCGVTSAAMVVAHYRPELRDKNLPETMARLSSANGFRTCSTDCQSCRGTNPGFFTSPNGLGKLGLRGENLGPGRKPETKEKVLAQLRAGKPIIAAINNGGHYVVLTGVNADGSISINDPNTKRPGRVEPADRVFSTWTVGFWYVHP